MDYIQVYGKLVTEVAMKAAIYVPRTVTIEIMYMQKDNARTREILSMSIIFSDPEVLPTDLLK